MLHSLVPCGNRIRWLSIFILLFSTTCRVIAAPIDSPSQPVENPTPPPIWNNFLPKDYGIWFTRVHYGGSIVSKKSETRHPDEVALIGIGTLGFLTPGFDETRKDWSVEWLSSPVHKPTAYQLGNVWLGKEASVPLIKKAMSLHEDDSLKLMIKVVSIIEEHEAQGFRRDQEGYKAWEDWKSDMLRLKQQESSGKQPGSASPVGGPSQPMEGNKLQKNNHKISLSGPIRFQRVRHDGDDVRKAEQAHQRDEVALIGVRTEGLWEPVYDQAAKKWIVNWRSDMNISPTKSHLLGNVKFQKDVSEVSVRKIMGLSADDPLELMYEVVSIVAKSGGFECDQEGYMAWMVWYMQMSDMKQLGQTKWIGVKSSNERPEKQRSSPSPGPVQGSSTHDSSSLGSVRGSPNPGSTGELASMHDSSHPGAVHSSAQSSKTAKSSSHSRPNVPDSNGPTEPTYDSSFSKLEEYYSRSGYPNGLYPGN